MVFVSVAWGTVMVVSFGAGAVRETPVGLIGTFRLSRAAEIFGDTQFDDLERRDLLRAGRSGYRCGRIALNLSLQAVAATPSQLEPYSCA